MRPARIKCAGCSNEAHVQDGLCYYCGERDKCRVQGEIEAVAEALGAKNLRGYPEQDYSSNRYHVAYQCLRCNEKALREAREHELVECFEEVCRRLDRIESRMENHRL